MFPHLQIYDPREKAIVGVADLGLSVLAGAARLVSAPRPVPSRVRRVLLLRLERIGDLLMTLDAIAAVRALAPHAEIDLVVGSWNADVAGALTTVDRAMTLDAPWLARDGGGLQLKQLVNRADELFAAREYDLAINFEGDLRSHFLMARSGAPVRVGFDMAGGGPLLTDRVDFDPSRHTAENALALVTAAAPLLTGQATASVGRTPASGPTIAVPADARRQAAERLAQAGFGTRPIIGVHASGGREIKQWPPERFGEAAGRLAIEEGADVLLTGAAQERALVQRARAALPTSLRVLDLTGGPSLLELAALLSRCAIYVTGDTGPMHLAAAVGTPVVAVFGPSDPRRYAPLVSRRRIVEVHDTLACAPCNLIRLPPERCRGVVPDCLRTLGPDLVYGAARSLWDEVQGAGAASHAS